MTTNFDIAQRRLRSQLLIQPMFEKSEDVVSWLGAVQAQDYGAAKWALGLRSQQGTTDDDIEQAFNDGAILRTHVMRPTWHFVSPADIRWLLMLTAPRVHAVNAYGYRELELDAATCTQCNDVLVKALQGGKQLTRPELASALEQAGIAMDDLQRMTYVLMQAELEGVICSRARRGKQFTYALLDERAPQARMLDRDEALAELTKRYFTSHGPATLQDFAWWSGLTMAEVRAGIALATSQLVCEVVDDRTYWFSPSPLQDAEQTAHLLPNFDEYTVGYKDRSAVIDASHIQHFDVRGNV
ncbi:MAG: winged helix DNA-binding domain-containing protein, partial [Ktedonobacteraceae bacterium]|nr:winged helix DNA-binding domain-containing protein [Ktedonobacteraceae bacterium]